MMELDQLPNMVNILVFYNHFTKLIMAYMTPNQTVKTVAEFLWQGYISIIRALAKLLSDQGANFENNITRELCKLMGTQKVRTSPYHVQANEQVEWAHQMLMCMIEKLSGDQKTDRPRHLPELVHAYNSTWSAISGYSPHYLMHGCWLYLPLNFFFPTIRGKGKHQHVDHYIAKLCEWLQEAFKEAQVQSASEAERQKWHCDRKANTILPQPGDLVLAKANTYRGRRKVKDQWEEEL